MTTPLQHDVRLGLGGVINRDTTHGLIFTNLKALITDVATVKLYDGFCAKQNYTLLPDYNIRDYLKNIHEEHNGSKSKSSNNSNDVITWNTLKAIQKIKDNNSCYLLEPEINKIIALVQRNIQTG